ncbi:hypothetical protein [Rhizobium sp. EC-SD404]|uniref:hypothetical protein n=1 Tax=Rhizobium sp. EC-SD404 TaxID=2038389 RepID=UPI00125A615E|nr:hypothetical protein [Rhizobium sp. EC-SD404]VVS98347.1 conserved hypothetical protein [Rhizobium sp. EC-SD404]
MRILLRILALIALVLGVMAGAIDAIQSVAADAVVLTPLSAAWEDVSPSTLAALEGAFVTYLPQGAASVALPLFLGQPASVVLLVFAFLMHLLAYRPAKRRFNPR